LKKRRRRNCNLKIKKNKKIPTKLERERKGGGKKSEKNEKKMSRMKNFSKLIFPLFFSRSIKIIEVSKNTSCAINFPLSCFCCGEPVFFLFFFFLSLIRIFE
jgi:hypothetical protein